MEEFPPEINVASVFPKKITNPDLAILREYIAQIIKSKMGGSYNGNNRIYPPIQIEFDGFSRCFANAVPRGLNYRNLMIIHQELAERGFDIKYNVILPTGKQTITFSEIDPDGSFPISIIIDSKENTTSSTTKVEPNTFRFLG